MIVMAKRKQNRVTPVKQLVKAPRRIGSLDAPAVIAELRHHHESAEDPDVERMPADDELFGALLYAEKHAHTLRTISPQEQQAAALKRVELWEYLREQSEIHQSRAITDARGAGAEWARLAAPMAVGAPSAAYNKAKRLRATALSDAQNGQPVRRTPEAVIEAEHRIALEEAAERHAQEAARQRHALVVPVAERLLAHQNELLHDDDVEYWLEEIEAVLLSCHTATQVLSLSRYLDAAVRALQKAAQRTATPAASTEDARLAYAAAIHCAST